MEILRQAKANAPLLAAADTDLKNKALNAMADCLLASSDAILAANKLDLNAATHISTVMLDRLRLTAARIEAMAEGIRQVAAVPVPVG